jgi:hypothetical protein
LTFKAADLNGFVRVNKKGVVKLHSNRGAVKMFVGKRGSIVTTTGTNQRSSFSIPSNPQSGVWMKSTAHGASNAHQWLIDAPNKRVLISDHSSYVMAVASNADGSCGLGLTILNHPDKPTANIALSQAQVFQLYTKSNAHIAQVTPAAQTVPPNIAAFIKSTTAMTQAASIARESSSSNRSALDQWTCTLVSGYDSAGNVIGTISCPSALLRPLRIRPQVLAPEARQAAA